MSYLARKIASRIIRDIEDRSGLGKKWEQIDDEVKEDIVNEWIREIDLELERAKKGG